MATFVRSALDMSAGLRRIDFRRRHAASPTAPSPETTEEAVESRPDDPDVRQALLRLAAREYAFGPRHPDVASELHFIGALHHEAGRYDDALAYYNLALAIREHTLSSDHPELAATLEDLAATREAQGEAAEAEQLLARAQRLRRQYRQLSARPAS
jgi:tetratricopeptide (TPR) repeat protein